MYDLVVIGAGPGGYEAAAHAGRLGARVALVEKSELGGVCLNAGCIPAKTLLRSSRLLLECRRARDYGLRLERAELDLAALRERKNRIVSALRRGVENLLRRAGVEIIPGHGRLAARNKVAAGDRLLQARHILIATGARAAVPNIPGIAGPRVTDPGDALDLRELPASLAVIGGGYVGLELGCFFAAAGCEVTVLEQLPEVAPSLDPDVAQRLRQALAARGIRFETGARVTAVAGDTVRFRRADGAQTSLKAERILNAAGRKPSVEDLGLEDIGVDFDARGIRTSEAGRTSVPGVWAAGDVTGRRLRAHAAAREGIVAVNNMFGRADRMRYRAVPSVIYTHPEAAGVGRTEPELQADGIPYRKAMVPMAVAGRYLIENEGGGVVKVLAGARYREILGVHALGDFSSEFLVLAAALIETEMRVEEAAELIFPHPTVCEALKQAVVELTK